MRAFRALVAAGAVLVAATAIAPSASATAPPRLLVFPVTSAIFLTDQTQNPDGPQPGDPLEKTVQVSVTLRHCPVGFHHKDIRLVQDGISYPWSYGAKGAMEVICHQPDETVPIGVAFVGDGLHPGLARVTAVVHDENEVVIAQAASPVVIPRHQVCRHRHG